MLKEQTFFGVGTPEFNKPDHEILERNEFREMALLTKMHGKAQMQLGTSGSGNHFVEFGEVEIISDNIPGVNPGTYVGLLSHSGARGLGATIAKYYLQLAMKQCSLPKGAQHLAWLDLNTQAGQEYWISMNLAGDYAKACHEIIHKRLAKALGIKAIATIESHHNFAWKEVQDDGQELIVHRKGATPAQTEQLGIIPASMAQAGYIVSGKGNPHSINSASHGSGRKKSRKLARETITGSEMRKILKKEGVSLIGGARDEAPMAYKDPEEVMNTQTDLVQIEGKFFPKIVRMDKA